MPSRTRLRDSACAAALAALLATGLASCGADDGDRPAPSGSASTPDVPSSSPPDGGPSGGTSASPHPVVADTDLLDWRAVPGPVEDEVTVSGDWTLTVDEQGRRAVLDGPTPQTVPAGPRGRIVESFIDGEYALVVSQDRLEERPSTATVVELATGRRFVLDGRSPVPTTTGGTWALGGGHALYATYDQGGYCLASVDLATEQARATWCAPPRHGFSNARTSPQGDTLLTFDASRPSCRTVGALDGERLTPFPGVTECKGWEGVLLPGGRVWSVVPRDTRIESAHLYAALGDAWFDLGPGISGSLVACGGAAYFAREPARVGEPAQVLRWTPAGRLSVVYAAPAGGEGFVTVPPRCGGTQLTVTALTQAGDEQVTAPLG
ncbi:MAG TPA: hypothetical protein PLP61_08450 [Nocardioides sp.]|uniref:hypothetical protein n=1 Tax=Nocardioides sp. TaxID=35761 RepID=UPI002C81792B|nr:hypothetical protein [Nocardioides sp.]HQR27052.1 hypothetical protein [Nocardioides sp.]